MGGKNMAVVREANLQSYKMPNALIHSPRMVSFLAASTLDAILINEQLNPRKPGTNHNKIRIKDLRWITNLDSSNNVDILEKVLDELLTVSAKWNMFGDDPDFIDVQATNLLQDYSYRKRSKDGRLDIERGFVSYRLTDTVVEIIDRKTRETELNVISARIFSKPYSDRFYQLGKSLLLDNDECEKTRTVEEIKEFLGVSGKYEVYKFFNYEVIKPSLKEVSDKSDIEMKVLKTTRKNRKIYSIVFRVMKKREFQMILPFSIETIPEIFRQTIAETEEIIRKENIIKRLKSFRMSAANIDKVMKRGLNDVEDSLMSVERQIEHGYKYRFGNRKLRHDFILYGWEYVNKEKPELTPEQEEAEQMMEGCGVDEGAREQLVRDFDLHRIKENIELATKEFEAGKTKTTLAAHVVAAIKTDYRPKKSSYEAGLTAANEAKAKILAEQQKQKEQVEVWMDEFSREKRNKSEQIWDGMTEVEQQKLFDAFLVSDLVGDVMRKGFQEKRLKHKIANGLFFGSFIPGKSLELHERDFVVWVKQEKNVALVHNQQTREYRFDKAQ